MSFNPIFYLTHFAQLTNIISKCSIWDTTCVTGLAQTYATQIIQNEINSETGPLDPLTFGPIPISDENIKFTWDDITIFGVKDTIVERLQFNKGESTFHLRNRVPCMTVLGNYTSTGFFDEVPYFGKGKNSVILNDFVNDLIIKYNTYTGNDGKNYFELDSYSYWFETPICRMDLEGLNEDKPLEAAQAIEYANIKCEKIWQQFGRNIFNPVNDKIFNAMQKFFRTTPVDDILSDF